MGSRAIQAELLQQRITENRSSQEIDLNQWIFDRLAVNGGAQILELCCGTGAQTLKFLEALQGTGKHVAVDVSQDALDTLASRVGHGAENVELLKSDVDNIGPSLKRSNHRAPAFDVIFCAYGLYYSRNPKQLLDELHSWLKAKGRMAVVGPFGPNNAPLFDLVRASGVSISEPVIESSERFMCNTLLPWAARNFESLSVYTMVNRVRWKSPDRVLNYWRNTTFFEARAQAKFEELLRKHFESHAEFVNEKWVMMVEMIDAR